MTTVIPSPVLEGIPVSTGSFPNYRVVLIPRRVVARLGHTLKSNPLAGLRDTLTALSLDHSRPAKIHFRAVGRSPSAPQKANPEDVQAVQGLSTQKQGREQTALETPSRPFSYNVGCCAKPDLNVDVQHPEKSFRGDCLRGSDILLSCFTNIKELVASSVHRIFGTRKCEREIEPSKVLTRPLVGSSKNWQERNP